MKMNDESGADRSIQASLKQAEVYAKHGQHAEAIKVYEQILSGTPKNEDALIGKIKSLRSRYEFAESEAETRRALEIFPQNVKFLNQDAELDFAKHQYEQAIKKFEQILRDHPKNDEAWAGKIKSLRSQYHFDAAEEAILNGLEQFPRSVKIRDEKGYLLCNDRHQYDETIKVANEILEIDLDNENAWDGKIGSLLLLRRFPEAEQVIQEALRQLPQNVRILNEQGSLHAAQQQHEAALKAFGQVLSIDRINVDAFKGKIKALRSQGKWDAANQFIQEMRDRPGNSPEMLNTYGWLYFDQKLYDKAIQAFDQTLKDVPNDEDAWIGKIVSLRWQSDFDKAAQAIQEALTRLPQNVRILNQRGYLYADQQQYEAALKAFEQGLSIDPINVDAFNGKIKTLRSQGKWDEANQALEKMCDRSGNSPEMLNQCGDLYFSQKQYDKAIQAFEQTLKDSPDDEYAWEGKIAALRFLGRFPNAEQVIQEALTQLPRSAKILNQRGYLYANQQQYEAALKAFEQGLSIDPINVDAFNGKIKTLRSQGKWDAANQSIQEMCDRPGNSPEMLNTYGWLYFSQKQYDKAIQAYEQTLKDFPNDEEAWEGKIASLRSLRRFPEVEQVIQEAFTRLPQNVSILNQQGYLYADQQQYKEALEAFEQGLSIDPINVDAFNGKIKALRSLEKWDEANQALEKMCDRSGNSPEMLNQCGDLYFNQQQYDKAIEAFEKTLKDVPNDEYAWVGKITALRWQSDFDKAEQAIQEALTQLPRNVNIRNQQAYLYADQQQYEKAIQVFDQTLNDFSGNEYTWRGKINYLQRMYRFNEAEETAQKALEPG